MVQYKITCPHCRKSTTDENYTKAMCTIPHTKKCLYLTQSIPTKMIQEVIP